MIKSIEIYTYSGFHFVKIEQWKVVNSEFEDNEGNICDLEEDVLDSFCFKVVSKNYDSEYTDIITNFNTWYDTAKLDNSYTAISQETFKKIQELSNDTGTD